MELCAGFTKPGDSFLYTKGGTTIDQFSKKPTTLKAPFTNGEWKVVTVAARAWPTFAIGFSNHLPPQMVGGAGFPPGAHADGSARSVGQVLQKRTNRLDALRTMGRKKKKSNERACR